MSIFNHNFEPSLLSNLKDAFHCAVQRFKSLKQNAIIQERNHQIIDALLKSNNPVKLEFGAGENRGIPGWTYADLNDKCDLILDLSKPLPLPSNCVDMIYSSHLLEHFYYIELNNFLKECLRILRPGGVFSAAVPNAGIYLNAYQNAAEFDAEQFCYYKPALNYHSKIDYVNYMAYMEGHHRFLFDEENIVLILQCVGFNNVKLREFDKELDLGFRDCESLYIECVK